MSTKMPTVDVEENIKKLRENIEKMTQEVFRLQGMLATFEGFKKGGLTQIDLPNDPNQNVEELESIQEKPE
jgi:lipid II:glycine glycyltransferase (peptidoglycan interpeptide bridge formation enzyme)